MPVRPQLLVVGGLVLVLGLVVSTCFRSPRVGLREDVYRDLGVLTAEEVRGLAGEGDVALIALPIRTSPPLTMLRETLVRELDREGLRLVAEVEVPVGSDAEVMAMVESGAFPVDVLEQVRRDFPDLAGVVSLAGTPRVSSRELRPLAEGPPLVVVGIDRGLHRLDRQLAAGVVDRAVVPRPDAVPGGGVPEQFEVLSGNGHER